MNDSELLEEARKVNHDLARNTLGERVAVIDMLADRLQEVLSARDVKALVLAEEPVWEYGATGFDPTKVVCLRESLDGALDFQRYWIDVIGAPSVVMKRTPGRKAGPWVPVKQEEEANV